MRTAGLCLLCALLACGCETTRSISSYQYDYNRSYRGELSQVEFIKDVSSGESTSASAPVRINNGERVIVMQSGQIRPDASLLVGFVDKCDVVPMSGMPSQHAVAGPSLRGAAKAGGVAKIVAYWGSIETSIHPKDTKAVSWVPIAGWYIPDESQKMRVSISAIVSDVASGQWSDVTVMSDETEISHSMMSARTKDSQQVENLKAQAYSRLVQKLSNQ